MREQLAQKGYGAGTIDTIIAARRPGTRDNYDVYLRKLEVFCNNRNLSIVDLPVLTGVEFLQSLNEGEASYSAINSARSALSSIMDVTDGKTFGQSRDISAFCKGVFNLRPPQPKYKFMWDADAVVAFLKTLSPAKDLPIGKLTRKLLLLMRLSTGCRGQLLHSLNLEGYRVTPYSRVFPVGLQKGDRPGRVQGHQEFVEYTDKDLCVCAHIDLYLTRTESVRGDTKQLFITYGARGKQTPASKDTLRRWVVQTLAEAGVDTSVFKAHSARGASSSGAKAKGLPMEDILDAGRWANVTTFSTFYDRDIIRLPGEAFQEAVLGAPSTGEANS